MKNKILVIDDDQDILDLTEFLLQEIGYDVVVSLTATILDDVLQINPDLILLDDWLGDTSGQEKCKILKKKPITRHIPVILFSASSDVEKNAKNCLADSYIEKPFDIDYLQDVINRLLQTDYKISYHQ